MLSMKDQVMEAIEAIEKLYERKGGITGISTGFVEFDRMTSGLHPSEMIVIAARPSMGKTALAMNIAEGCRPLRSEEHTSELQSHHDLVCRLLLEKKNKKQHRRGSSSPS